MFCPANRSTAEFIPYSAKADRLMGQTEYHMDSSRVRGHTGGFPLPAGAGVFVLSGYTVRIHLRPLSNGAQAVF